MLFEKLISAIRNNVVSGLQGYHHNTSFTPEQVGDDIVNLRLQLLTQYALQGKLPLKDLYLSINCIATDCKDIEKCSSCRKHFGGTPTLHFEIPQVMNIIGAIDYIGSPDKQNSFKVYTSLKTANLNKYRKSKAKDKPYVWVDTTPNEHGYYDCFVFNAPLLKYISVVAIFKDPRQLNDLGCCDEISDDNFNFLNAEIIQKLSEQYLRYYRQGAMPSLPNDQRHLP